MTNRLATAFAAALLAALPLLGDDAFTIKDPFTTRAISSCGNVSMSGGSVTSAGFGSAGQTNRGNVAANGNITLSGSSVIDGDASVGPGKSFIISGTAHVTGTKTTATTAFNCTPIDLAPLSATLPGSNDNARIPLTGLGRNPLSGTNHTIFSMSGADTITLPAGTYYFTSMSLSGGSVITVAGPVRIFCAGSVSLSGGSVNNAPTGGAYNPYRFKLWTTGTFSLSSSTMAGFLYAPSGSFSLSSSNFIGGVFANSISISGNSHVTRTLDDTAPSVTITAPAEGAIVADPAHVDVRGTATDGQTAVTLTVNGQAVPIAADGTFQTTVNLTGVNPPAITAVATDAAGNSYTARVNVTTTPPPVLTLSSPPPGSFVNSRIVNASGGSGNAVTVTVNGIGATVANGVWSVSGLDLGNDGAHTLTIVGTNAGGSSTISPVITSDTVAPSIQATASPAPNAAGWNKTDVTIHFTCSDSGSGIATCPADFVVTYEGANLAVTRSAVDRANNSTPVTVTVNIDKTAPVLAVTAPPNNQVVSDPHLVVTGTADDSVVVTVNGAAATVDAAAHTFTSSALNLAEGRNDVAVAGTDIAGNSGSATVVVNLDARAPELTVTAPAANACLNTASVTVSGRAVDPRLDKVMVALDGGTGVAATVAADGTWTASISLPNEGRSVITVQATDTLQHLASSTVPIVVDRTRPVVQITSNGAPFTGGAFNRPLTLFVRATDADAAAVLTTTLNGSAYVSGTQVTADGSYTLRATARDCAGNVSDEASAQFVIDTVPLHVVSTDPANGAALGAARSIAGTVDADDLKSATIEGTAATAAISGRTFTFAGLSLAEGNNAFVIDVADNAGNVTRVPYAVQLKSNAPGVEILESGVPIAPNALFNRAVTPMIRSNEPNATISATLNSQPYTSGTAISGETAYTLSATATDSFGHTSAPATATFSIDRTPPGITISATVSGDHADVTGTVTGGDVTTVSVGTASLGGAPVPLTGGSYAATVALELGSNTIIATAVDAAGNAARATIDVTRGDDRPGLILISPENGSVTNRPTTVVAGQLLTAGTGARVTVNGTEVTVDAAGTFRRDDFALVEGDNAITATIVGTPRSVTVHVTADFTAPALKVLANGSELSNGMRFATSPAIALQVDDPNATKVLIIDGVTIPGASPLLADGGHSLSASARDAAGNETRVDRTFFVGLTSTSGGAGCGLTGFDPPNNASIFGDKVKLTGQAGSAAMVLVNGTHAHVADGTFCASVDLAPGANTVTIACADAAGTPTSDSPVTLTLNRATAPPTVTVAVPASPVSASSITVTGTVGQDVVSGEVNGIAFTPANGAFTVPNIQLAKGLNVITARARSSAGRLGVATASVVLAGPSPQINITSPLPSTQTGAAAVDVTGTYVDADPSHITITAGGSTYTASTKPLGDTTGTFTVSAVALAPNATTTITATAVSLAGTQAQASVDVQQDAGSPSIAIDAPLDNTFYRAGQQSPDAITGTISPVSGSTVQVGGVQATVDASFRFTANVPFGGGGATPIVARVTTPDGKSASDSIRVVHFAGPLAVTDSFPAANATGVDAGAVLVILFSNPLDAATAHGGAFTLAEDGGAAVTGTAYVDKDAVSFAPGVPLTAGKHYTLTVSSALKDLAGGSLAAPYALSFTTGAGAPDHAPLIDQADKSGCLSRETITGKASTGAAKVRLDVDGVTITTVASGDGSFSFAFTLSGRPGFHAARVREIGADGTLSPEAALCYQINCAAPQVLSASLDRAAKKLTVQFSRSMTASTLVAAPGGTILLAPNGGAALSGTLSTNPAADLATINYSADLSTGVFTLTVSRDAKDSGGIPLAADFVQTFDPNASQTAPAGSGFITGAVYDETTGRPLPGASVSFIGAQLTAVTDDHGRYSRALPEGAYTIEAGATGYSTVWRQVVVPAGAGVAPIDIRLTRRGPEQTSAGAMTLTNIGDPATTRQVELTIPAAALPPGRKVTLTSIGAQSLAGLLPLGWSPLASGEIAIDAATPIPASRLTFVLTDADVAAINAATQTLSIVQYDPSRDEWHVVVAVAAIDATKRVAADIDAAGNYAVVYPDRLAALAHPPAPHAGAALAGVANPCTASAGACAMTSRSFAFFPPQVTPAQRSVATLVTDGEANTFPSGTAVQAYIDEQLNLADGRVLTDAPFATDLLIYRSLAGTDGVALFHIAPTSRAASETLRDGVDHVRVVDYPARIDRGTLLGSAGGRVPGDETMAIDIPSSATIVPLHASMTPMSAAELAPFQNIAGFHVAGGFTFALTRSDNAPPVDLNGDGIPDPVTISLLKPARGTFTVDLTKFAGANQQLIVAEVLGATPFGSMVRLAATTSAAATTPGATVRIFTTNAVDSAQLPVDGIVRDGRYLLLTADAPVAFAWGLVRSSANGPVLANARVTAASLGVPDLTRSSGMFALPVPARPAAPFSLRAATPSRGAGTPAVYASSPDPDAKVRLDLILDAQPPHLVSIAPRDVERNANDPLVVQVTFDSPIDRASVHGGLTVTNLTAGTALAGGVDSASNVVSFTPGEPLQAGSHYEIKVLATIRGANGAPFGQTASAQFSTRALPTAVGNIHPEKIQITLPDNGVSMIRGSAGALPPHAIALAVRRERSFVTQYQKEVSDDGSFSFAAGAPEDTDRITTSDLIDLQVIDAISHAVIAVIPLTPFVTVEGDGFLAPVGVTTTFVTTDGIGVTVPASAFDSPTLVRATPAVKSVFDVVPAFNEEMHFVGAVHVDFDGVAKERLELDIPPVVALDPTKAYYLGRLIETARGPRIEIDEFLRIDGGKLTTTLPAGAANAPSPVKVSSLSARAQGIPGLTTAGEVKHANLGVVQRGDYTTIDVIPPIGWIAVFGLRENLDYLVNLFKSAAISGFWVSEKGGKALMPVLANRPFVLEGVDQTTGVTVFTKPYDVQVPVGDPLSGVLVPSPEAPVRGPYPTFAALGRIEVFDINASSFTDDSREGFIVAFDSSTGLVTVSPPPAGGSANDQPVEILNVTTGVFKSVTAFTAPVNIAATKGQRIIILTSAKDVDPLANVSFAFSEPIAPPAAPVTLDSLFDVGMADPTGTGPFTIITKQAKFTLDSGGRRVTINFPVGLQRGKKYQVTLKSAITGTIASTSLGSPLGLGQVEDPSATPALSSPARDLHVEFITRGPGGEFGSFTVRNPVDPAGLPGTARDFALDGNILYVAGTSAGLLAYDVADPAALNKATSVPFAWAPVNTGVSDTWGVATDHHGRVWSIGMTEAFGFIRGYTTDGFLEAKEKANLANCGFTFPKTPGDCPVPALRGAMIVSYRPGFLEAIPLSSATLNAEITTTITTKPEAMPRKLQILTQELDAPPASTEDLIKKGASAAPIIGADPFVRLTYTVPFNTLGNYYVQRVTMRNTTLNAQWSKDILRGGSATFNLIGRPGDQWLKSVNVSTYAVVNLFGFGLGVYDLNQLESNRWTTPPDPKPRPDLEQVMIASAKYADEKRGTDCSTTEADPPPDPYGTGKPFDCQPIALASIGQHCPIPDLTYSPESVIISGPPPKFGVYGLHSHLGLVDFKVNPPVTDPSTGDLILPTCDKRGNGLTLASHIPWPTIVPPPPAGGVSPPQPMVDFDHPRLNSLRNLWVAAAKKISATPPAFFSRFTSMALYVRRTPPPATAPPGTPDTVTNYGLIAAADYGLLVVKLDITTDLDNNSLVDVVWVPAGAFSVRVVPGAQVATVTDGAGRILLVDLTAVDESGRVAPLTPADCSNPDNCTPALFPTAAASIVLAPAAPVPGQNWFEVGVDDPRIVWKSKGDPTDLTRTTLAPVIDGETGILYKGDFLDPKVKIVAAADPRVRYLADLGDAKGPTEVAGITPLGIDPPAGLLKCTPSVSCKASAAIFRLDVALPGAIAESLASTDLYLAVESEPFIGVPAVQTPSALPRSSLRQARRDGGIEPRNAPAFKMQRLIPNLPDPDIKRLRYQKAYNHFVSPWVVAVADPRASERYVWPAGVNYADKGCFSCTRPASLQKKRETDGYFELYTTGRYIAARPEHTAGTLTVFSGTPYKYLGDKGRLERRVSTIIADVIHPPDFAVAAENPPVAGGAMQETTYLHSGELESNAMDLDAGGRAGWNTIVDRTYRSRTIGMSPLGWGWDSSMFARLRPLPNGTIEYRDGLGEVSTFTRAGATNHYTSTGLALKLVADGAGWRIFDQQARYMYFDQYGRLMARSDHFADPATVMNDNGQGNVLRYFYDAQGRLSQLVDPVNRTTKIDYYPENAGSGAEAGLVKEFKDWRTRKVTYEYDSVARLHVGKLPEAANSVAAYDMSGSRRPYLKYDYNSAITSLPPDNDTPFQQVYNDFLELAANLEAITDPAENAGANGGVARVTFTYDSGTDPDQRDHVKDQKWPCANVTSGTCAEKTASITYAAGGDTVQVTDMLKQVRDYTLFRSVLDEHRHIKIATENDVPVIEEAGGAPPTSVTTSLVAKEKPLKATFGYDEWGHVTTVDAADYDYAENNVFGAINTIHPGTVLKSSVAGSSTTVHTEFKYDSISITGVELSAIGRDGGSDPNASVAANAFRATPATHRDRLNIERTETHKQNGTSYKQATAHDKSGLPLKIGTYESSAVISPTGNLPGGETRMEDRVVNPDTGDPYSRGRYKSSKRTDAGSSATDIEITYAAASSGGETETATDSARTPAVITTVTRDAMGRVVDLTVSGAPSVHEKFGYDPSGHLVYHTRQQDMLGEVVEKTIVDPLGRALKASVDQAAIGASAGQTVETTTDYDLTNHTTTVTLPPNAAGIRAKSVTTTDRLGRPTFEETTASGMPPVRHAYGYDQHGALAYESDTLRTATLIMHDSLGREKRRVGSDGLHSITDWTPWGEVADQRTLDGSATVAYTTREYATEGAPEHINEIIDASTTASTVSVRSTAQTWSNGGRTTGTQVGSAASLTTGPVAASGAELRVVEQLHDVAGRVTKVDLSSLGTSSTLFKSTIFDVFDGTLPRSITDREWQRGGLTFATLVTYDALGNATNVNAAGGYRITAAFDQLGNQVNVTPSGLGNESATYDSRGLQTTRNVHGANVRYEYDALGGLTKYTDESGTNSTTYERDALGRVTRVTFPDSTTEETTYEDQTGTVKATKDRAGQWLAYAYDAGGRLTEVHKGADLTTPMTLRYDYDLPGHRLHRIANLSAACEYEDYDMLGRPRTTRSIRYAPGGDLSNPASLTVTDVHVQKHEYSVFGMERTRWRMPAAGHDLPPTEPLSPWRSWIEETRDGAGKLIKQVAADTGFVIATATSAGVSELGTRTRNITGSGAPVVTTYAYKDSAVTVPAEFGGGTLGPSDASGELRGASMQRGTAPVAGSEIFRNLSARVAAQRDFSLADRGSLFTYDPRGRLTNSKLHLRTTASAPTASGTPPVSEVASNAGTIESLTSADFRSGRKPSPVFSATQHGNMGNAEALRVEPPVWNATEKPAHEVEVRTILLDGAVVPEAPARTYTFSGGRRTSDGQWTSSYDELGRLVQLQSGDRRIVATYDPLNRLVGRTAYKNDGAAWVIEDRADRISADGLPAATTFVWDAVTDRLLTITTAGSALPAATDPNAGLLRQYVHGDRGYDDPVEVMVADAVTGAPKRMLPMVDEAGTGSLEAVVDGDSGNLVERVLYGDAYGDVPRYLQGPIVDKVTLEVTKDGAGSLDKIEIRFHLTDKIKSSSAAAGARVVALKADGTDSGTPAGTAGVDPDNANTILVRLNAVDWQALRSGPGAVSLQLAVTAALRAEAWGDVPVSQAPSWARSLFGISSTTALPVAMRESLTTLDAFIAAAEPAKTTAYPTIYSIPNLYVAGLPDSKSRLMTGFKSAPFVEPASGFAYFRDRWYSPTDGNWLTPDAAKYRDSSDLYAYCGADPINCSDPLGLYDPAALGHSISNAYAEAKKTQVGQLLWALSPPSQKLGMEMAVGSVSELLTIGEGSGRAITDEGCHDVYSCGMTGSAIMKDAANTFLFAAGIAGAADAGITRLSEHLMPSAMFDMSLSEKAAGEVMSSMAPDITQSMVIRQRVMANIAESRAARLASRFGEFAATDRALAEEFAIAARGGRPGFVYRGIHARHPALGDALRGEVVPGDLNGTITAEQHNLGGYSAESPFTSWSHDFNVARDFALRHGPGGVILELPTGAPPPGALWRWVSSPDAFGEAEVLLRGMRSGAKVIRP